MEGQTSAPPPAAPQPAPTPPPPVPPAPPAPPQSKSRGPIVAGLILITLGIGILVAQFTDVGGGAIVGGIGVAFLAAFLLAGRNYGFLVPGGILTGLGLGILAEDLGVVGEPVVLGLGFGFVLIWLIDLVFRVGPGPARWWPLIPGGILLTVGVMNTAPLLTDYADYIWPAVLIIVGAIIVVSGLLRR